MKNKKLDYSLDLDTIQTNIKGRTGILPALWEPKTGAAAAQTVSAADVYAAKKGEPSVKTSCSCCPMTPDIAVSVRHYGTQRDGHVVRAANASSRDRVLAVSLIASMVVAAVCCVVFLSPVHTTALESDQDSIDALLNKIDKLTASTSPTTSRHAVALAPHAARDHVRLNVETPEQKFLDEVSSYLFIISSYSNALPYASCLRYYR